MTVPRGQPGDVTSLPIEGVIGEVRGGLAGASSLVLTAEPGAGKTTIVPLRLLDEPWAAGQRILLLEPRRVAARAAAARMATLLGQKVGETVGVVTRGDRRVGSSTRIEVVTEGVLTRRLQRDPELVGVAAVIFDEFHERSLHADLGLALTLDVQRSLRPELRLVVMSATIDTQRVAGHLDGAVVVSCPGRTHPVEVVWRPLAARDRLDTTLVAEASAALGAGSVGVLAFLPGAGEIARAVSALRDRGVTALPLHGSLPAAEQDLALRGGPPRVVVATDLAETSLTVPDIDTVVDSGLRRAPRFHPGSGMSRLELVAISKASADQRAGRAGRLRPGRSIRLWAESEHLARPAFDRPEILDTDLADLLLQLAAWGIRDVAEAPLLDQPETAAVEGAAQLLGELGLIDGGGSITSRGRRVVELGVHPRLGCMLVEAGSSSWTAAVLAALLEEPDLLRGRRSEKSADLEDRLRLVEAGRGPAGRLRRRAQALSRREGNGKQRLEPDRLGELLTVGFPDRIGRRQGRRGRFVLANGSRVEVAETDPLAAEEWVVAAEVDGDRSDAVLLRGAGLDATAAREALAPRAVSRTDLFIDDDRRGVVVERIWHSVGPIVLDEETAPATPGAETAAVLVERIRREGLKSLPWSAAEASLLRRSEFVRAHTSQEWPDLSEEALLAGLDEWLAPLLWSARSLVEVKSADLRDALHLALGRSRLAELARLAPAEVVLGSGRTRRLQYDGDKVTLSVRVQDLYGETTGPSVMDGREPVVLELLSPAGRPIQVTSDLAGFWTGSWRDVRKEMAGRYPKHNWPNDPGLADAGGG